jgi:MarC family membrane protein
MPAAKSAAPSPLGEGPDEGGSFIATHIHRSGTASAQRQKALATGPVSESLTKMGANAIAQPPARRQRKGTRLMEARIITPHMTLEILSAIVLLTLVIDPFGNVPVVNAMLAGVAPQRRRIVIARECAIAFLVLLGFMFGGRKLLQLMHLSETSLSIAGGVILFMIAIRMVFAHPEGAFGAQSRGEPLIVPLAIPLIAGPSALATVMLMATREPQKLGLLAIAVTASMAIATVVLVTGERLQKWMGDRAMQAVERLMGLILTTIAVEMLLGGIRAFAEGLK